MHFHITLLGYSTGRIKRFNIGIVKQKLMFPFVEIWQKSVQYSMVLTLCCRGREAALKRVAFRKLGRK